MALSQDVFIISSFELISSGIIDVLFKLFSNVHYGGEGTIARFTFLDVFQGDKFKLLVKKLQESLTRSEMFEIVQCGLKTDENRATSLGKQLKLKLVVLNDDEQLFRGMSQMVILVHAIASFSNISSFLKRRVENPFGFATRVSAAHNSSEKNDWHVEFLLDNEVVPFETTIYGALYKQAQNKNKNFDTYAFWNEIHEIRFRKAEGALTALEFDDRYPEVEDDFSSNASSGSETQITTSILNLLKILHDFAPDATSFLNFKLTAKLNRQLEEPLIVASGILPNWSISITRKYPFLFPLETRIFFLQSTSFGYSRLIQLWNNRANQEQDGNNDNSNGNNDNNEALSLGRPTRHKVRVSRNHLLKSCYKVLDKLGSNPSVIEIEFTDEVGTGLGPTLEFYASVSHLFAKKKLGIWRQDQEDYENKSEEYVQNKAGLFPEPLNSNDPEYSTKLDHFKYIGKFVARALLDNRIVDMNFNRLFFELAESEINDPDFKISPIVAFEKFKYVDKRLYDSLKFMRQNKSQIDDLEITFTLPGRDDYELIENGADIQVTSENIDEYIDKVVDVSIGSGVKEQIEAFIVGFSEVFPFFSMTIFSADELVQLLGRSEEDWSYETLISSIHAAHGYSLDSKSVQSLIASMVKFDDTKRRLFLQFLTGSPRLPIGGFKKLKPDFTVVLKRPEDGLKADDYLPSVMTCANYLKLPDYSSAEMFEQRLDQAIKEGAGSFLLS
jgi:E3 ubiquitin-protein ligase TRIP12